MINRMGKEELDKLRARLGQDSQLKVHGLHGSTANVARTADSGSVTV